MHGLKKDVVQLFGVGMEELTSHSYSYSIHVRTDPTLTNANVSYVMEKVQKLGTVSQRLHIPAPVRHHLNIFQPMHHESLYLAPSSRSTSTSSQSEHKKGQYGAAGKYWRNTVPSASWESMACVLYSLREYEALTRVKEFLRKVKGAIHSRHCSGPFQTQHCFTVKIKR